MWSAPPGAMHLSLLAQDKKLADDADNALIYADIETSENQQALDREPICVICVQFSLTGS